VHPCNKAKIFALLITSITNMEKRMGTEKGSNRLIGEQERKPPTMPSPIQSPLSHVQEGGVRDSELREQRTRYREDQIQFVFYLRHTRRRDLKEKGISHRKTGCCSLELGGDISEG